MNVVNVIKNKHLYSLQFTVVVEIPMGFQPKSFIIHH